MKNPLTKVIAYLAIAALGTANWITVFVWGFGVSIASWWVVVGCGVFNATFIHWVAKKIMEENQ